jgi:acyl carrier protein
MPEDTVSEQLRSFIVKTFPVARNRDVGAGEALLESGIVDSLGVLNLVGFIESEYKIEVADDDLLPENFQTIERLAAFVRRKLAPAPDPFHERDGTPSRP